MEFIGILTLFVVLFLVLFYREFIFVSFNLEGAKATGTHTTFYNHLFFLLSGIFTVMILEGVGAIPVSLCSWV
ncbi:MAG: metal ABC transporter permease [Thermoplasmata archaeon]|nr:metal ABC transporter permease [Thermoplasmata archaeon]